MTALGRSYRYTEIVSKKSKIVIERERERERERTSRAKLCEKNAIRFGAKGENEVKWE